MTRAPAAVALEVLAAALLALAAVGCGPKPIHRAPGEAAPHPTTRALEDVARPWLGTAYRYGHYDYSEKTIDEKNDEREMKMWRSSGGRVPSSSGVRWRR